MQALRSAKACKSGRGAFAADEHATHAKRSVPPVGAVIGLALLGTLAATSVPTISRAAPAEEALAPEIEVVVAAAGEVLAVGDLCQWDMAARIETIFQAGAKSLGLSERLQRTIRAKVIEIRNSKFSGLTTSGRARTKSEICTPEERAFLEKLIAGLSLD